MRIGVLGSGDVARTLAAGFQSHGYEVMMGTRERGKLAEWVAGHPGIRLASFGEAAAFGEIDVLAVKGGAAEAVLRLAGADALTNRIVIDATNPISDDPPDNGVLRFFTSLDDSLLERLQRSYPALRLVKAFNSVGSAQMVNPSFAGGRPTMFICGNDKDAKVAVAKILNQFGWDSEDMGGAQSARAIEPLCMLWCARGFLYNEWQHAFKLLK